MIATSVINQLRTSEVLLESRLDGNTIWRLGPYRERYNDEDKVLSFEYLYRGDWYVISQNTDAFFDNAARTGGLVKSGVA